MFVTLIAAALLQTPAAAPPATTKTASAKPVAEKEICRTLPQTGSMFAGPKECHTKSEWEALNAAARDNLGGYQQRSHQLSGGGV